MNTIKKLRAQAGYTQAELVEKTGLSLRTIQRLEASTQAPKGYSLQVIAEVFELDPTVLQETFRSGTQTKKADQQSVKLINLAILTFIGIPFGNIVFPFAVWRKKRHSKVVDEAGRKIINLQICWTVAWCTLLCLAPFVDRSSATATPLIMIVLFAGMGINLILVGITARLIQEGNLEALNPPFNVI